MRKALYATTAAIALALASGPSHTQQPTSKEQIVGTWKVVSLKATAGDKVSYPLGE